MGYVLGGFFFLEKPMLNIMKESLERRLIEEP